MPRKPGTSGSEGSRRKRTRPTGTLVGGLPYRTAGSASGLGKRTRGNPGTAPQADSTGLMWGLMWGNLGLGGVSAGDGYTRGIPRLRAELVALGQPLRDGRREPPSPPKAGELGAGGRVLPGPGLLPGPSCCLGRGGGALWRSPGRSERLDRAPGLRVEHAPPDQLLGEGRPVTCRR